MALGSTTYSASDSPSRGRRRRSDSPNYLPSESSPLKFHVDASSDINSTSDGNSNNNNDDNGLALTNYSTFTDRSRKQQQEFRPSYWLFVSKSSWADLLDYRSHTKILGQPAPGDPPQQSPANNNGYLPMRSSSFTTALEYPWKILYATLFLAVLLAFYHGRSRNNNDQNYKQGGLTHRRHYSAPESQWDHNIYIPSTSSDDDDANSKSDKYDAYLVAQLGGSSGLDALTDISSRPNRAYCRQHSSTVDYVRYTRGEKSPSIQQKSCFDKVILLNTILDKQMRDSRDGLFLPSLFSLPPQVEYDAVALLSPDSIIMNMDSDIFDLLLAPNKLVAIAGWNDDYARSFVEGGDGQFESKTGVVFFNLRHKHANAVAKLWWDIVESPAVSCGAGNDLALLVDAIVAVLEDGEDLASVIAPLDESEQGFVGQSAEPGTDDTNMVPQEDVIKGIVPSTPESRAHMLLKDLPNNAVRLQTTSDSVCYRFYPRCEIL